MTIRFSDSAAAGAAALLAFALYRASLAPDLGTIDSGELAAVCVNLGIAHPTGYPLYTLLGRLFVLILPAGAEIFRLNLLSALCSAAAVGFCFVLFRRIASVIRPSADPRLLRLAALGLALGWGVSGPVWSQAVGNEVHALQGMLVAAMVAASLQPASVRQIVLLAYLTGLAFANHMTTAYLLPALLIGGALDPGVRSILRRPRPCLAVAAAFISPLLLYLYLPIRSFQDPALDWGDPTSFTRLLRHLGGAQYRVWMFASKEAFTANLAAFARGLLAPDWFIVSAAAIPGFVFLLRAACPAAARLLLGFLVGAIWASGYEIHDLAPYYMVARLCLAGLAVAGLSVLLPETGRSLQRRVATGAVPILLAAALAIGGWNENTRRGDRYVRTYAGELLERLPDSAILLSRHWDIVVSPLLYMQQVEGLRPDVTVVDPELLRRSWYFPQLRRADPTLLAPIEDRVEPFLEDLRRFEAGEPYDPARIEQRYRALIAGIFEAHRSTRPVLHTPDVESSFYGTWFGVPEALVVRMVEDPQQAPPAEPLDPDQWRTQGRHAAEAVRRNAWSFPIQLGRSRIRFLDAIGRTEEADRWRSAVERLEAIPLPEES